MQSSLNSGYRHRLKSYGEAPLLSARKHSQLKLVTWISRRSHAQRLSLWTCGRSPKDRTATVRTLRIACAVLNANNRSRPVVSTSDRDCIPGIQGVHEWVQGLYYFGCAELTTRANQIKNGESHPLHHLELSEGQMALKKGNKSLPKSRK